MCTFSLLSLSSKVTLLCFKSSSLARTISGRALLSECFAFFVTVIGQRVIHYHYMYHYHCPIYTSVIYLYGDMQYLDP